jgi:hypothetical protein
MAFKKYMSTREGRIKNNDGGGEFNYDTCKNFCKCYNVPPTHSDDNNNKSKEIYLTGKEKSWLRVERMEIHFLNKWRQKASKNAHIKV